MNVENEIIKAKLCKSIIYLLYFIRFIFSKKDMPNFINYNVWKKHSQGLIKIINNTCLLDDNYKDTDTVALQVHAKEIFLSQASNTQGVEAKIKDISFCKKK